MKSDLLSLSELADLWGKQYQALKREVATRHVQQGRISTQRGSHKHGAVMAWQRGTGCKRPAPTSALTTPRSPTTYEKKYYAKNHDGRGPPAPPSLSLTGDSGESSPPSQAEGSPNSLQFLSPSEDPRPGKDIKSHPAVGHNLLHLSSSEPSEGSGRLPDSEIPRLPRGAYYITPGKEAQGGAPGPSKEIPVLPGGASLKTSGDADSYWGLQARPDTYPPGSSYDLQVYGQLPDYAKKQVDKYLSLVLRTEGMSRAETEKEISLWNRENPELAMSSRSLRHARKRYREEGVAGLASRRGGRAGHTIIRDEWLDYFRSLYLKEGAPSAESCWIITRGSFSTEKTFPHPQTFVYQLRRRVPQDAIYMARHGEAAWNRKYGMYIERDYSNILCGEVWVGDHAQLDVAVADSDGKPFFPWVTAWRDMKSGKWLGWLLHREPPNADQVFQSFYYACRDFGIPRHIYIDNGKDYRAKDFAGGRTRSGKLTVDEASARSICAVLRVDVSFRFALQRAGEEHRARFPQSKRGICKTYARLPGRTHQGAPRSACRRDPERKDSRVRGVRRASLAAPVSQSQPRPLPGKELGRSLPRRALRARGGKRVR